VFVEYVMLKGVNDRYEQALALARLLAEPSGADGVRRDGRGRRAEDASGSIFKVNLIPYNPTGSPFAGSTRASIAAFRDALLANGIPATIRLTRGQDIDAACGQLAARTR
jgi:23S rRNA (adenine2503-C2)-methyltransferase